MTYDPLSVVRDEPLHIDASVVQALREFRLKDKLLYLPGVDVAAERARLSASMNALTDALIEGVAEYPSKLWVMERFQHHLEAVRQEDTEAREHFGAEIEVIMDILAIDSSDGLLSFYLGGV